MNQFADFGPSLVRKVSMGLLAGIACCLLIALLLFFLVGEQPLRVPSLNVQVLPEEPHLQVVVDDEILARPLFWESRRPIAEVGETEAVDQVEQIQPLAGVRLLGIIMRGQTQTALLEVDGKPGWFREGDAIKQWRIAGLTEQEVRFSSSGGESLLTLEREVHKSVRLEP